MIEQTIRSLCKNNMPAELVKDRHAARQKALSMIGDDVVIGAGGSVTAEQCGIWGALRGRQGFFDWMRPGISPEEKSELRRKSLLADVFVTGTNAITMDGKLYNCDFYGNRVAAMVFGPKKVIVVAGKNKIVKNIQEAKERMETVAAPLNSKRLGRHTPCVKAGYCTDCDSPERICCHTVIQERQMQKRIHVIIVDEELEL